MFCFRDCEPNNILFVLEVLNKLEYVWMVILGTVDTLLIELNSPYLRAVV
jgi:hypothetical protein